MDRDFPKLYRHKLCKDLERKNLWCGTTLQQYGIKLIK